MARQHQILDMSPLGMIFTVLQASEDTAGRSLDLHWELFPGCNMKDPLIHIHPHAVETYDILSGEMEVFVKDKWIPAKKGDTLAIPAGIVHGFRNPSGEKVLLFNTHQPALKMENYFEDVCRVLDKLTVNRSQPFRMNLKSMLYMGVLMDQYRNDIIAKSPPDAAIKLLGRIGRLLKLTY